MVRHEQVGNLVTQVEEGMSTFSSIVTVVVLVAALVTIAVLLTAGVCRHKES